MGTETASNSHMQPTAHVHTYTAESACQGNELCMTCNPPCVIPKHPRLQGQTLIPKTSQITRTNKENAAHSLEIVKEKWLEDLNFPMRYPAPAAIDTLGTLGTQRTHHCTTERNSHPQADYIEVAAMHRRQNTAAPTSL